LRYRFVQLKHFADKIPKNARCNFEDGWCGWTNVPERPLNWTLHQGPTPTERTGPSYDHTYRNETGMCLRLNQERNREAQHIFRIINRHLSLAGTYAFVNMASNALIIKYGSRGTITSPLYNPTPPYSNDPNSPYYRSCQVRAYFYLVI